MDKKIIMKFKFELFKGEVEQKKEKLESQKKTLTRLGKSGLNFIIFGSWAGKIEGVYGDDCYPNDIDILIDQHQWDEWNKFLDINKFSIKDIREQSGKLQIIDKETGAFIDGHLIQESADTNYYIEQVPYGTFQFPKTGFETKLVGETFLTAMRPELSYIIEKGGPTRSGKEEKIKLLEKTLDQKRLEEIAGEFKFTPSESIVKTIKEQN